MVQTSKSAIVLGLVALCFSAHADGVYTRSVSRGSVGGSGGATAPGGSDTQIQFNNAGAFGGAASATYTTATGLTTLGNISSTNNTTVSNLLVIGILEVKPSTSTSLPSTTQLLYMRPAADGQMQMDSALGAAYDNVSNRVTIGTPTGALVTFGDTLRVSGTQTITGALTAATISATGLSASGNFDVTGTTKTTGLVTAAGGVSDTGNLSVTGNTDVTGTLKVVSTSTFGNVSATILAATSTVSTSGLLVSSTDSVSITSLGFTIVGTGTSQPQICQVRNGVATWCQSINNPTAYSISVSGSNPIFKADPNGIIIGKNINTGVNASNALQVSGSLGVTGGVSLTGLAGGNGTSALCVSGAGVVTSSTLCVTSSKLVKENIVPSDLGLNEIMQLRPVTFTYKEGFGAKEKTTQVGLIAEDVQKVIPEISFVNGSYLSVNYLALTAVEVKAIQELKVDNDAQQAEIEDLRMAVDELRKAKGLTPKYSQTFWQWITGQ